jgi:bacterioferritin-associated ferredoxin/NifU-like protein involved in Fe-S cluster formation
VGIYPDKINDLLASRGSDTHRPSPYDARGVSACFSCGCFAAFELTIEETTLAVRSSAVRCNGCGYMVAAAEVLRRLVDGRELADLHGLDVNELTAIINSSLGEIPPDRASCLAAAIGALRHAFASFRSRLVAEYRGDVAIICTCFGISEDTVAAVLRDGATSVEDVADRCRAGSGCGSCRFLIQELIDTETAA